MVQPLRKRIWKFLNKLHIKFSYDPAISPQSIIPQRTDRGIPRNTCTQMFIALQFAIAKNWKQPKYPSIDKQMDKQNVTYTYHRILFR